MKRTQLAKRTASVSMAAVLLLGTFPTYAAASEAKWAETETQDGWILVTNEGGDTLGYSPESGVSILEEDGYAFKDLNKNGTLDAYEDWREDDNTRAAALASQLSAEQSLALMMYPGVFTIVDDGADGLDNAGLSFNEQIAEGKRSVLAITDLSPVDSQVKWNNSAQAYAESLDFGIPVNISSNPRTFGIWPDNLALAATFAPEMVGEVSEKQAQQYRSLGIATLLGPQIDLSSEPRWSRISGTYGEDPALSRDMTNAVVSGLQSTYDENGEDLGWGEDSVNAMIKHFPGDGAAEGGRESHSSNGKYNVYPGDSFETHLIPFIDGGLSLDSSTGEAASVMTSYSIAWSEDGSLGDLVGSAFSEYKINILREEYGYDGLICTDWGVTIESTPHGVEELTSPERECKAILAGVDQLGQAYDVATTAETYKLLEAELGEEGALARVQDSARRILRTFFQAGLFENPYVSLENANARMNDEETLALGENVNLGSIVMLKNENNTIKASEGGEKATVYIPMQFNRGTWSLPVDLKTANAYYNVVTDTVGEPTGEADKDGNATYTVNDIVRATPEELSACSAAIVIVRNPQNQGGGYDSAAEKYIPISLQYGEYTAVSEGVRSESIAGDTVVTEQETPYGVQKGESKENRSYYGESAVISNVSDYEGILYAVENMPEDASVIVALNTSNPVVVSEFESQVDAILVGFGISNDYFLKVTAGEYEPSGLLPIQFPADMETVEAQQEDVPRDMECYVDAAGNTYDFAYGLNWSGVISDERTAAYAVEPLTTPEYVAAQ